MSSVPIQLLIYVAPKPSCAQEPIILPFLSCLEVAVGVTSTFNVTVLNKCAGNSTTIDDVVMSNSVLGVQSGNMSLSSSNRSVVYKRFIWTPQLSQIGEQKLCFIAYTE